MKKRIAVLLALLLVLSLGLSACGKPSGNSSNGSSENNNVQPPEPPVTVESLFKGFREKTESGAGVVYNMEFAMKITVSILGQTQAASMNGKLKTESNTEIAHITGSMTSDEGEGSHETKLDTWSVKDGDKFNVYSNVDGTWYKQVLDARANIDSFRALIVSKDVSNLQLSETDNEYLVTGTIDVGAVLDVIKDLMGTMDELGDVDMLDLSKVAQANVSYRFDKATKDLTSSEMDLKDCFQGLMDELMKAAAAADPGEGEDDGEGSSNPFGDLDISAFIKVATENFIIRTTEIKVDPDLKLVFPEEAKNARNMPVYPDEDEDYTEFAVEEMSIYLPSSFEEGDGSEYGITGLFGSENAACVVRREDKSDVGSFAKDLAEYEALLLQANADYSPAPAKDASGRPVFEYTADISGTSYSYYTTAFESEKAFWMVQFYTFTDDYEELKPLFEMWTDTVYFD